MAVALDLVGQKFGRLTVLKRVIKHDGRRNRTWYLCSCECGVEKEVREELLKFGKTKSCGCYSQEERVRRATTHGRSKDKAFGIWRIMIYRCTEGNKHQSSKYYSERGIKVCDRWQDFKNFYEDMGEPPEGMTLERVNNDGNYEPGNVIWATRSANARNRRTNRMLTYNGKTQTTIQWAEELKLHPTTIATRLFKGWSIEDALTRSTRKR